MDIATQLAPYWPLLALGFSLCGALIIGFNQWAQLPGAQLVAWRWLGVAPLAVAALLVLPAPTSPMFYAVAALMGAGLAWADVLLFNASRVHGARLTALYIPLKMLLALVLWAAIDPLSLMPLMLEPWRLPLLMGGLALCAGALMFLRQSDASFKALIAVFPVAGLFALGDVVAKGALPDPTMGASGLAPVAGSAVAFLLTTVSVGSIGAVALHGWQTPKWPELWRSALFGAVLLASLTLLLVTLALAPNPGYVAAITMLSALWLAILARLRGAQENMWAGLGLLLGAICVAVGGH
jgi:hypothetical protein